MNPHSNPADERGRHFLPQRHFPPPPHINSQPHQQQHFHSPSIYPSHAENNGNHSQQRHDQMIYGPGQHDDGHFHMDSSLHGSTNRYAVPSRIEEMAYGGPMNTQRNQNFQMMGHPSLQEQHSGYQNLGMGPRQGDDRNFLSAPSNQMGPPSNHAYHINLWSCDYSNQTNHSPPHVPQPGIPGNVPMPPPSAARGPPANLTGAPVARHAEAAPSIGKQVDVVGDSAMLNPSERKGVAMPSGWNSNSLNPPQNGPTEVTPMNADAAVSRNRTLHILPTTQEIFENRRTFAHLRALVYRRGENDGSVIEECHGEDAADQSTRGSDERSKGTSAQPETSTLPGIDFTAQNVDELTGLDEYPPTPTPVHSANIPLTFHQAFHNARVGPQSNLESNIEDSTRLTLFNTQSTTQGAHPRQPGAEQQSWDSYSRAASETVKEGTLTAPTIPHLFSPTPSIASGATQSPPPCPIPPPAMDPGHDATFRGSSSPNPPHQIGASATQPTGHRPLLTYYPNTATGGEHPSLPQFPAYGSDYASAGYQQSTDVQGKSVFGRDMIPLGPTGFGMRDDGRMMHASDFDQGRRLYMPRNDSSVPESAGGSSGPTDRAPLLSEVGALHAMTNLWTSSSSSNPGYDPRYGSPPSHGLFHGGATLTAGYPTYHAGDLTLRPSPGMTTNQSPYVSPSPNSVPVPPFTSMPVHCGGGSALTRPGILPNQPLQISTMQPNDGNCNSFHPHPTMRMSPGAYPSPPFEFFQSTDGYYPRMDNRTLTAAPVAQVYSSYETENEQLPPFTHNRPASPPKPSSAGAPTALAENTKQQSPSDLVDPHMESLAITATRTAATAFASPILDPGENKFAGENTFAVVNIMRQFERYENAANQGETYLKEKTSEGLHYELDSAEPQSEYSPASQWTSDKFPLPPEPYQTASGEGRDLVTVKEDSVCAVMPSESYICKEEFSKLAKTSASCDGHPITLKPFYDGNKIEPSDGATSNEQLSTKSFTSGLGISPILPPVSGPHTLKVEIGTMAPPHIRLGGSSIAMSSMVTTPTATGHSEESETVSPSTTATSPEALTQQHGHAGSSVGASLHPASCKPCAFVWTKGCINGKDCQFCHEWHLPKKKKPMKDQKNLMIIARPDGKIEFLRCTIEEALRVCY